MIGPSPGGRNADTNPPSPLSGKTLRQARASGIDDLTHPSLVAGPTNTAALNAIRSYPDKETAKVRAALFAGTCVDVVWRRSEAVSTNPGPAHRRWSPRACPRA